MYDTTITDARMFVEGRRATGAFLASMFPHPVYLLFSSDGAPRSAGMPGAWGTAGRTLDLLARPWLEARGRYVGRQPAIYIDDIVIREAVFNDEPDPAWRRWMFGEYLRIVALHEAAHVVDQGIDLEPATRESESTAHVWAAFGDAVAGDDSMPPWVSHNLRWCRIVCHLRFRALQVGLGPDLGGLIDWQRYGLTRGRQYWQSLMAEMIGMVDVSLFEIAATPPPPEALELWRSDVIRWRDKQPSLSNWAAAICERELAAFPT